MSLPMLRNNVRDIVVISAGPLGSALFSIVLIFIVSWNFAPEVLGVLAILELVALLFVMIFTLGLDQAYVREFAGAPDKFSLFAAAFRVPALFALGAAVVLPLLLPAIGVNFLPEAGDLGTAIAIGYGLAALAIRMLSVALRMGAAPSIFAGLQIAQRGGTVLILALFLSLSPTRNLSDVMLCYLGGAFLSVLLHAVFCSREVRYALAHRIDAQLFRSLLRFGLPAAAAAFLYALLSSSDRLSLAFFGSNRDLGIYAVALSIAGSINIFTSVFAVIWAPLMYKNEDRARDISVVEPYLDIVALLTFLAAGAVSTLSWFLPTFFPADYLGVAYFVPACMALPLLYILSEAFGIGIGVSRRMGFATLASAASAAAALGTSFLLVPAYGAAGAAFGVLIGALCFLIARTEIGALLWYRLPSAKMYLATMLYFLGCAISLLWASALGMFFPLYWVAFSAFCLLLFRHRIGLIMSMMTPVVGWRR